MILCVTPSPAIDRTARVDRLAFGAILRPVEVVVLAGGKGDNVARAVRALGGLAMTTGFAGGHAGRWLVESLDAEGLNPRFVTVAAETRTTYVTVDAAGRSILVYEPAAPIDDADATRLLDLLASDLLPAATRVAGCGSAPAGGGSALHARIVRACRAAGRPVLVDAGGPALGAALDAGPDIVKVSRDEAASVVGQGDASAGRLAEGLVERGAGLAIVTDGPHGAAASDGMTTWTAEVPRVRAVDPIGSGDAFTAGLLVALEAGRSTGEALAWAAAAGTANAEALGAGRLDETRQVELVGAIKVRAVSRVGAPGGPT